MKKRIVNPFRPDKPMEDPDNFIGRIDPVESIVDNLFQTMNQNPVNTIVTGGRGMGKSSLLLQAMKMATGDNRLTDKLQIDRGCDAFDFVAVSHTCDSDEDAIDLAVSILKDFEGKVSDILGKVKFELNIAGIAKLSQKDGGGSNLNEVIKKFVQELEKVQERAISNGKSGVIIFIDELDRLSSDSKAASFFKVTTELLLQNNIKNVAFFGAGITGVVQKLGEEHASIDRTFRDIPLPEFSEDEVRTILEEGFESVGFSVAMPNLGKRAHEVSMGYPERVHLIGKEMLNEDKDGCLAEDDFEAAIVKIVTDTRKNQLSELLRNAGSGKYQKILNAMAQNDKKVVPLSEIAAAIGYEQNQFSTNMGTLVSKGVIRKPVAGKYEFDNPMLKEYIKIEGALLFEDEEENHG